jgi:hypothetical protein
MPRISTTYTLVARVPGQLVEVALGNDAVQVMGTIDLTGTADKILDALPHHPHILCISHADGTVCGLKGAAGTPFTALGNLVGLLGYQSLDRRLTEAACAPEPQDKIPVSVQYTNLVLATRCIQRGTATRLGETVALMKDRAPLNLGRRNVVQMLIEALTAVSDAARARAAGQPHNPERVTVGEIFVDLIPVNVEALRRRALIQEVVS